MITFIRIPKNASTSLYSFFGEMNAIRDEYLEGDNQRYLNVFAPSHCSLEEASDALGSGIRDNPVFAVVRNPYDRLVSMFSFAKKYNLGKIYDIDTEDFGKFAEGFYKLSANPDFFHAKTQKEFIASDTPVSVGRFETLEQDVESFIKRNDINVLDMASFPKLNSTVHDGHREYYSDKSKSIVQEMWGDDLEYFSYSY